METSRDAVVNRAIDEVLEKMNGGIIPLNANRFDKLCELSDAVQCLIDDERSQEVKREHAELKKLRDELAAKEQRLAAIAGTERLLPSTGPGRTVRVYS